MNAGKAPPAFTAPFRRHANFGSRCRLAAPLRRAMRGKGARGPRALHSRLDARGASQVPGCCKRMLQAPKRQPRRQRSRCRSRPIWAASQPPAARPPWFESGRWGGVEVAPGRTRNVANPVAVRRRLEWWMRSCGPLRVGARHWPNPTSSDVLVGLAVTVSRRAGRVAGCYRRGPVTHASMSWCCSARATETRWRPSTM